LLSLANVLLWFVANAWRREFLSLSELLFLHLAGGLSICIRLTDEAMTGKDGIVKRMDRHELLEWSIGEDDLRRAALSIHHVVSFYGQEYDRLLMGEESEFDVHVRMTDAAQWLYK